jgi:hypothetical protein
MAVVAGDRQPSRRWRAAPPSQEFWFRADNLAQWPALSDLKSTWAENLADVPAHPAAAVGPVRSEIQMLQMGFWPPFQIRGKPAIAAAGLSTAGDWRFYGQVVKLMAGREFPVSGDRLKSQQVHAPKFSGRYIGSAARPSLRLNTLAGTLR